MPSPSNDDWTSESFRAALTAMVRRRVPEGDVDDVVQAALTEAVARFDRPRDPEAARKWIWGVARNKIADHHRRARREAIETPEVVAAAQQAERDLLRWAVGELPPGADAQKTFEWLLREGEGETLEDIAADERLPATQVRQRVSRLRRLFRSRWAQLMAAGLLALVAWIAWRSTRSVGRIGHGERPTLSESPEVLIARARGRALREEALAMCERSEWQRCLDRLEAAKRLDPAGDDTPGVRDTRRRANDALIERHDAATPHSDAALPTDDPPVDAGVRRRRAPAPDWGSMSTGAS